MKNVKTLLIVDTDVEFVARLRQRIADEDVTEEFSVVSVVPKTTLPAEAMIETCVSGIIEQLPADRNNIGVFIDIVIVERGDLDTSGIAIATRLRAAVRGVPIFLITAKLRGDQDQDVFSHATLLGFDGVLTKAYLEGKTASAKRLRGVLIRGAAHANAVRTLPSLNDSSATVPAPDPALPEPDEVVEWLVSTDSVNVAQAAVVGEFVSGNPDRRDQLRLEIEEIRRAFGALRQPYPVLLCAAPGSGKSFFVEQVAAAFGVPKERIVKVNLSSTNDLEGALRSHFVQIAMAQPPVVAYVDEVDTPVRDETAYRYLLDPIKGEPLDIAHGVKRPLPAVLWFFAASAATDHASFVQHVERAVKGRDFLRRFTEAGRVIELPGLSTWRDRVLQGAVNVRVCGATIRAVEAVVLLFFARQPWADAGELKGFVATAVREHGPGEILTRKAVANDARFKIFEEQNAPHVRRLGSKILNIR